MHNMISESVKKTINEISSNAAEAGHVALKKARKNGGNLGHYVVDKMYDEIDRLKEIRDYATKLSEELRYLYQYNPRLNIRYFQKLIRNCDEIYYAFKEDGSIADAIFNQSANKWFHRRNPDIHDGNKPYLKPYKARDVWEPVDDNEEDYDEPEDWYERNEHGDFDRFY